MSDRPLRILLVDQDPIFRLGLGIALAEFPHLQVVSEAATDTAVLQILAQLVSKEPAGVDLVILELGNSRSLSSQQLGLQLCQQLKTQYPNLPILLLSSLQDQKLLLAAKFIGVEGYCPKGTPVEELVTAIEQVAAGHSYWYGESREENTNLEKQKQPRTNIFTRLLDKWRLSGIAQIDASLVAVTAQLQAPDLTVLERAVLAGQRRELLAARWLVNHLLSVPQSTPQKLPAFGNVSPTSAIVTSSHLSKNQKTSYVLSPKALQVILFASCINKLQFPLENLTDTPLEIDILRPDRKRELLYLILQKIAQFLEELRSSQIEIQQLSEIINKILHDLWREATTDFFGKFSRVRVGNNRVEIVNILLQSAAIVQAEILNKIPLVVDLFAYLLFQSDLTVDNRNYPAGSLEAKQQAERLLENLLIQVANSVMQPLLNSLADIEDIKRNFYDRSLISTREIERFRNNLSWKYRIKNYIIEPKTIFESRYELFVLAPRGIAKVSIYAPRTQELRELSGIPLLVTLGLEFADAIAPRFRSLLSFLGNGVVFILTQIVGRGLGLIVRGILQGIGSVSLSEGKNKKL
jgi:DNA-binding NarL/FixJ family response regulator